MQVVSNTNRSPGSTTFTTAHWYWKDRGVNSEEYKKARMEDVEVMFCFSKYLHSAHPPDLMGPDEKAMDPVSRRQKQIGTVWEIRSIPGKEI